MCAFVTLNKKITHLLTYLQHSLTCFGANLSVALIVAPAMCVEEPKDVSEILSTIFFVSGLVTLLQSTVGTRSPLSSDY